MIQTQRSMPSGVYQVVVALCLSWMLPAGSFAQIPELKGFESIFDSGKVDPEQVHGQLNKVELPKQKSVRSAAEVTKPKQSKEATTQGKLIELQKDLNEAHRLATLEGRPLLAIFGADWCTWCRKLELELQDDQADKILKSWIVVKIDADRSPELAEKMNVSALPALRVLDFQLNQIAAREGYMPLEQLETWLDEKYSAANPVVGQVLFGTGQLSAEDIEQLVALLADRSPKIRAAAQTRLTQYPARTAKPVTEVFIGGKLSQKLASQQILKSWNAPVEDIDPWNSSTLTTDHRERLEKWLAERPVEKLIEEAQPSSDTSTDTTQIRATLEELLKASSNQGVGNIELSPALVPAINQALEAENLTDIQREMLRELKYNALASSTTRLAQSSLLKGLASLNTDTHRKAAEKLIAKLTEEDKHLIDELSGDLDSIVRELSVPEFERLNLLSNGQRVTKLLQDKSPSVRTAVLRSLSQRANGEAVDALLAYIDQESDEDLLVFAAKTLGKLKLKKARESMAKLLKHSSWRVRAATIDAIAESVEGKGGYSGTTSSGLSEDLIEGVMQALQDNDSFVVHRSSSLLPKIIDSRNASKFISVLIKNAAAVDALVRSENYGETTDGKTLADAAVKLLNSTDQAERLGAVRLISRVSPKHLFGRVNVLSEMLDQEGERQEVALKASIGLLAAMRDEVLKYDQQNSGTAPKLQTEPWYPVPDSMQALPKKEKKQPTRDPVLPDSKYLAETNGDSTKTSKQEEADDLFGSIFDKPKSATSQDNTQEATAQDATSTNTKENQDSKKNQNTKKDQGEATTTSEPKLADSSATANDSDATSKSDSSSLDALDGFFGAAPKQEAKTPKSKPPTATDLLLDPEEDLFEEMPKTPQAKRRVQNARDDKKNPNYGLTSFRINQYLDRGPATFDVVPDGGYGVAVSPKDIAEVTKLSEKIRRLQSVATDKKQAGNDLLEVAAVVCGNQSIAEELIDRLLQKTRQEPTSLESKNLLKLVLPWANAKVRLKLLQNLKIDFSKLDPVQEELLEKATFVDDYAIADWLFEHAKQLSDQNSKHEFTNEEAKNWNSLRKFLQRSLFGTNYSLDKRWIYDYFDADIITPAQILPLGTIQSIKWMQKSLNATESARIRASLLANLTFVDSMTAREAAIGYLAQATAFENPLTDVAIQIGLNDNDPLTLDRAIQLLGHPLRQVRIAALEKLTKSKASDFSFNNQGLTLNLKYTYESPETFGLYNTTREFSATDIEKLVAEFATDKSNASEHRYQALALQLLVQPQMSIDQCIDQTSELESRSLVAAVLVKIDRKDDDVNQFFAKTVELFNNHPSMTINNQPSIARELKSSVKAFYASLKKLRGAEYAKLRTDLRKRYSTILDN